MLTTALLLTLCAAPQPVRIAATQISTGGEDEKRASVWLDRFAEVMGRGKRVEITTPSALAQLLGMERQRQLMGCANDQATSCMAELAAALGAEGILSGSITRSGASYVAVMRVIRQEGGKVWWSASARLKGEEALLDWLDAQAEAALEAVAGPTATASVPVGPFILGGVGVAAAGVGVGYLAYSSTVTLQQLHDARTDLTIKEAADAGKGQTTMGLILVGGGSAVLAASIIWLVAAPKAQAAPQAVLVPLEGGALVSLGGRW